MRALIFENNLFLSKTDKVGKDLTTVKMVYDLERERERERERLVTMIIRAPMSGMDRASNRWETDVMNANKNCLKSCSESLF